MAKGRALLSETAYGAVSGCGTTLLRRPGSNVLLFRSGGDGYVIKQFVNRSDNELEEAGWADRRRRFNPDSSAFSDADNRYRRELAGSLSAASSGIAVGALTWDDRLLTVLFPRVGIRQTLCDHLAGDQRSISPFRAFGRSLARLHSVPIERDFGESQLPVWPLAFSWFSDLERRLSLLLPEVSFAAAQLADAIRPARTLIETAQGSVALTPGDFCPDNCFLDGSKCLFFDFEFACYRSIFIDLACVLASFPTCWCRRILTAGEYEAFMQAYFHELRRHDSCLRSTIGRMCSETFIVSLGLAWAWLAFSFLTSDLEEALAQEALWGTTSFRTRHVLQLREFGSEAAEISALRQLASIANTVANALQARWSGMDLDPVASRGLLKRAVGCMADSRRQ
jgi:hypothetical protein